MLSDQYNGSICEVKGLNNTLLGTGTFQWVDDDTVEAIDKSGGLPRLSSRARVKLIVHNSRLGIQVVAGKVYVSDVDILRIKELESFAEYEKRRFFRQNIDHSATLLIPEGMLKENGEPMPPRVPVRVKDVSLCGLLFESAYPFQVGDEMCISMTTVHNELETLKIIVRRIVELPNSRDNKKGYGCEVLELNRRMEQRLNAFVLEQQQRQIRRSRR